MAVMFLVFGVLLKRNGNCRHYCLMYCHSFALQAEVFRILFVLDAKYLFSNVLFGGWGVVELH